MYPNLIFGSKETKKGKEEIIFSKNDLLFYVDKLEVCINPHTIRASHST